MTGDQTGSLIYAALVLMLVASALFARRMPLAQWAKMLLAWAAIFAVIFVLFSFRGEAGALWARLTADFSPETARVRDGRVEIVKGEDGHFTVRAQVNGVETRFLIDSGATTTALSPAAARSARVAVSQSGFPVLLQTANGTAEARRARIERLTLGPIERGDVPVLVTGGLEDGTNLLGMDFLSSLQSWRVEGNTLILNP